MKEKLLEVRDLGTVAAPANGEPKTRKPRRKKGLPTATPPASETNLTGRL
jgi:hypothetical protein